jgi:hypothetical protein
MLRNLRPIRLSRCPEPFDSDEFLYELKIDGFRALAHIAEGKGELISRSGNVFRGFAELATWIAEHQKLMDEILQQKLEWLLMWSVSQEHKLTIQWQAKSSKESENSASLRILND